MAHRDPRCSVLPDDFVDGDRIPYTARGSRLLVFSAESGMRRWAGAVVGQGDEVSILEAAYERPLSESVRIARLTVLAADGSPLRPSFAADGVRFGAARLVVTAEGCAVVSGLNTGMKVVVDGAEASVIDGATIVLGTESELPATQLIGEHDAALQAWMLRMPTVRADLLAMSSACWWILGVNTLAIDGAEAPCVVPSKLGYVGLWQWDAYFIALGLRHGDPELALDQLRVAMSRADATGQLPDVVHDEGVLISSAGLPAGDIETLRALGSPSLAHADVPLTKPPLTALAMSLLLPGGVPDEESLTRIAASQEWWFDRSDPGCTGWPAYLHPYSSGLDDSPIFDRSAIVRSPDLAAYLIVQDRILATWAEQKGDRQVAERYRARARELSLRLSAAWDDETQSYLMDGENGTVRCSTILDVITLLVDDLDEGIVAGLVTAVRDPERFGGNWPFPTVSRSDRDFSPERMWRGPIWINTAWLCLRGLETHGEDALAAELRERLLELVIEAGGPAEYFNPQTGQKAETATSLFGWSAALFVDMAVTASTA